MLAGALRAIGNADAADNIVTTMKVAGHNVRETNSFEDVPLKDERFERVHSIVWRLHAMWEAMRNYVIAAFSAPSQHPRDIQQLLKDVEASYEADAYHHFLLKGIKSPQSLLSVLLTVVGLPILML